MTTHDEDKIIAQQARIERLTNFIKYAQVSSGVCCCGDSMEGHPSPMTCGHSPVDMWDYHSGELLEAYPDDLSALRAHDEKLRAVFQAGAASRDAEIAELVGALGDVTAHLVAAHSLLSRGGKKAAASDTVFKIMLQDYEKSFEAGRKALAKVRKPTFFEAGRQSVIEGCDDGTIDWRGENEV